ncbi:MAG: hypothetical protein K1X88_01860 [Nannocystaceae bacterium]|nr:hypothetical protein [Nannocystaceae bacterium]
MVSWLRVLPFAVVLLGGCASIAIERLGDPGVLPVASRASPWSGRIEVRPFAEGRGTVFARPLRVNAVPVVNLFYDGRVYAFPDATGGYSRPPHRRTRVRAVGELPLELPHVLARALGPAARVADADAPAARDYVVSGTVLRTEALTRGSTVLAFVAFLGVPYLFARNDTVVRVTVHRRDDPLHALMARDYRSSGRKTIGAYYNTRAESELARATLVDVVDEASGDIARVVADDIARRR